VGLCDLPRDVIEHMLVHFGGAREAASLARTCGDLGATVMGRPGEQGILCREDDVLPVGIGSVGGVVTIPGVLRVTREVRVMAGVHLTIRGGRVENTLGGVAGVEGGFDYAFVVDRGGSLVLEAVRVVGAGVKVCGGGTARLVGCDVLDAPAHGVFVCGKDSRVEITGGSVSGSKERHGISAQQGGHAVVKGVQISSCARYGLCRVDVDSHMEVGVGVTIRGCGRGDRHGC